ncbi:endonuclease VII domain-containing protein [Pseudonocardia petroleophila]|uniref:Endonuclease VII domain-containing protein n=1 Tax=Pseudonocardia petroleophila TaxID=37331 RepID=A0A7G7MFT9_9PSEU|nr:endonuclease VII domain-containing protein [Pseudonocardia petroleophila]QNG51650.1 endonuclease VII domain-containing protein [Pseudonocardia petroleophila]
MAAHGLCSAHLKQAMAGRELTPVRVNRDIHARDAEGRKECATCRQWCEVGEYRLSQKAGDGLTSNCRKCSRAYTIQRKYGISPARYDEMLAEQGEQCAICRCVPVPNRRGITLVVDHDHSCCPGDRSCNSCVRALICVSCNIALGAAGDDVDRLNSMIGYLKDHRE